MKLSKKEKEIIQLIRDECGVPWHDVPYAVPCEKGIYVSLTEDDKHDRYVTWAQWEDWILGKDPSDVLESIRLLEKSLERIKRQFEDRDEE